MINKKTAIIAIGIIVIAFAWLFLRFVIGGDEDTWICDNGVWVAHGNPSTPKPSTPCMGSETDLQISNHPSVRLEIISFASRATVNIGNDAVLDYEGVNIVKQERITNSKTITQDQYADLINLINNSGFFELDSDYKDGSILDASTNTITVTVDDEIETVSCYGNCPEVFTTIKNKIIEIYGSEIIEIGV